MITEHNFFQSKPSKYLIARQAALKAHNEFHATFYVSGLEVRGQRDVTNQPCKNTPELDCMLNQILSSTKPAETSKILCHVN